MARGDKKAKEAAAASAGPRAPPPTAEVMQQLASTTHFTAPELQALVQRFAQLDTDGDGSVDAEAVCEMGEVAMYPLLRRVVSKYNEDKSGSLTFAEFCQALSTLSGKATLDEKLHFAFDLYDVNGNGAISPDEMFDVFRLMSPRRSMGAEGQPTAAAAASSQLAQPRGPLPRTPEAPPPPPWAPPGLVAKRTPQPSPAPGGTTQTTRCSRL